MADIRQVDDLIRYGRLHGDTLVLEEDVKLTFLEDMQIPFALKVSGTTTFQGEGRPTIDFKTTRPSICCSTTADHFRMSNLHVLGGEKALFKFQRNFLKNISFSNMSFDAEVFGELGARSLNFVNTEFQNENQAPIILDNINSITTCSVKHYSKYPLFDMSEGKVIRDGVTIHDLYLDQDSGLIIVGYQDDDGVSDLTVIPKHGITISNSNVELHNLLKVRRADGTLLSLPANATKQYFL